MQKSNFITLPLVILILMWASYFIDAILINCSFIQFGIIPRNIWGLIGIPLSPFVHANLFHLISNSGPLLILLLITSFFFRRSTIGIIILIVCIGGGLVWLLGRSSYHVGASGLVYGLVGFLVFYGIFKKKIIPLILSLFIGFTYGASMLIGLLPIFPGVSWEGHLFGAVGGFITAKVMAE